MSSKFDEDYVRTNKLLAPPEQLWVQDFSHYFLRYLHIHLWKYDHNPYWNKLQQPYSKCERFLQVCQTKPRLLSPCPGNWHPYLAGTNLLDMIIAVTLLIVMSAKYPSPKVSDSLWSFYQTKSRWPSLGYYGVWIPVKSQWFMNRIFLLYPLNLLDTILTYTQKECHSYEKCMHNKSRFGARDLF